MNNNSSNLQNNIFWHHSNVRRYHREKANGHRGVVVWFTGLPASGKSTIAHAVEEKLFKKGCKTYVLDGDNIRHGLCSDLGFSDEDRRENIRRVGEVAKLMVDAGLIVLTAFVSPRREDRKRVRNILMPGDFIEIYCECPVEVCESRDPKGLYRRAKLGEIKDFTGISAPYEPPLAADLTLQTAVMTIDECVSAVIKLLDEKGIFSVNFD